MHHAGCEMPHRCVRRKCSSRRFSASSLTDSLRSVVRLRRAVSTHSKTKCCYPQNQGITPKETCEQKTRTRKRPRSWRFSIGSAPLTSITKTDAQVRGGETRQDLKIPGVSPWWLPRALSCSNPAAYRIPVRLSPFGKRGAFS